MPANIYVHLTWTTEGRTRSLGRDEARFLRAFLPAEAVRHNSKVVALGVVANHVHVLLFIPTKIDIPRLVQGLKGGSARLINKGANSFVKWASGYDVRSVSPTHVDRVVAYIHMQPKRHPTLAIVEHDDKARGSPG